MTIGPWIFNGFDIVVLLVVLISLLMAASRGLFRELVSIAALIISAGITLFVFGRFRFAAQDFIKPSWLADGALGIGTFALTYMLMVFLLSGVVKSLKGKDIGLVDRLLGAGFGAGRGLVIAALFTMIATASYREGQAAQSFKDRIMQNEQELPPEILKDAPKDIRDWLDKPPPQLPSFIQGSTLYPILDKIGAALRRLPFADVKDKANSIKAGDAIKALEGFSND